MKKLSIIVPCYKVEKYLERCLEALVNQTLEDIEIICVNDGSPDNSIEILKKYREKNIDKIVIIDKKNEGVWKARKDGVAIASGEYIGFVDADDYVALDYAEKLYKKIVETKAEIAVCGFERIDMETGKVYSREMCKDREVIDMKKSPEKVLSVNTALWNKIYKAQLLKEMYELKAIPVILEDVLLLMLSYMNTEKLAFVKEPLYNYMVRMDSAMNSVKKEQMQLVYDGMKEVRRVYEQNAQELLMVIDTMAFLHLGISLMFRLSCDQSYDMKEEIRANTKFMDQYFPYWKKSKYITLNYMMKNGFDNLKLWIIKWVYKMKMFRIFLWTYRFMINTLKIDLKW